MWLIFIGVIMHLPDVKNITEWKESLNSFGQAKEYITPGILILTAFGYWERTAYRKRTLHQQTHCPQETAKPESYSVRQTMQSASKFQQTGLYCLTFLQHEIPDVMLSGNL
jgi:hypothetical protein